MAHLGSISGAMLLEPVNKEHVDTQSALVSQMVSHNHHLLESTSTASQLIKVTALRAELFSPMIHYGMANSVTMKVHAALVMESILHLGLVWHYPTQRVMT